MSIQPPLSLSEISSNGSKLNSLPTDIFKKLRTSTTEEATLQAGVEIVHQTLKCDRVVVYSMQSDSMCKITAEAVTAGYGEILDLVIRDSCFEEGYKDKYQKGRVRATTDIYESGMNSCHIENLEKIDVKSNLVVPLIANDKSLYGLLVMHQCSRTRRWQQTEIEFVLSVANWITEQISQQQALAKLEERVKQDREARELIVTITREIHGAATSEAVLQLAVEKAKEILNCDRVVVYCLQDSSMGEIVAEATVPALAPILANVIKDPCFEYRYIDRYQKGRVRAISNIYEAGMSPCYIDNLAKIGVKSNLVAPINWDNGQIYGLLVAHQCFSFKDWQESEIEYFKQIAFHAGLSLSKAKFKEQSVIVETGLSELDKIKDSINLTQGKIGQMEKPIQNTSQILIEVNNLNRLLEREIEQINQNASLQTKKNTKLIHVIVRKLATVVLKLRQSLIEVNNSKNEAKTILKQAIVNLDGGKSVKS